MRPSTPNFNFNFSQQAGPSSPPQTPTTPQFQYRQYKTRRNGMFFTSPPEETVSDPIDIPTHQHQATSSPFYAHHSELSPRSSSPTSSTHSSLLSNSPPRRSLSSSPNETSSSPPLQKTQSRIVSELKANFTVEEFRDSEYEDYSDSDSIIRPTQYEDAESERGSTHGSTRGSTRGTPASQQSQVQIPLPKQQPVSPPQPIDPHILSTFDALHCSDDEEDEGYKAHQEWVEKQRAEKRRKRRSSSSFKRSLAQSIGSDTDDEDLMPGLLDANDAGSSARRLRRRTERTSLIFDDPPARIEEESYEEVVEIIEEGVREDLARTLPYWIQEDMELDTSSEEEEDDDDDDDNDDDENDDEDDEEEI